MNRDLPSPGRTVRALSVHARYACAHSGQCCRAGWPIPVEADVLPVLGRSLSDATVSPARPGSPLTWPEGRPASAAAMLGRDTLGVCVFFDASQRDGSCRVHRRAGVQALPISCRQFPRIARHDARAVDVSLSHWCPTALAALELDMPVSIIESPPAFAGARAYEGLDARTAWPPLLRPDCLFDDDAYDALEQHTIAWLTQADACPWAALSTLCRWWERLRAWRSSSGPLVALVEQSARNIPSSTDSRWDVTTLRPVLRAVLHEAVPADLRTQLPRPLTDASVLDDVFSDTAAARRLAGRYLAARFFGSWLAYQGGGLRSQLAGLGMALTALEDGFAAAPGTALERLRAGIRTADLMVLHLAVPEAMARAAWRFEHAAPAAWVAVPSRVNRA